MLCLCIQAAASKPSESSFEAKLCFAHAETIIPLVCLLGLFGQPWPAAEASMAGLGEQCSLADVEGVNANSQYGQPEVSSEPVLQQPTEWGISSSTDSGTASSTDSSSNSSSSRSSSNIDTCSSSDSSIGSSSSSLHCDSGYGTFSEESTQGVDDEEGQVWVPPLPRPPLSRDWYGSMIAPYGANIQFALHRSTDTQVSGRHVCAGMPCRASVTGSTQHVDRLLYMS